MFSFNSDNWHAIETQFSTIIFFYLWFYSNDSLPDIVYSFLLSDIRRKLHSPFDIYNTTLMLSLHVKAHTRYLNSFITAVKGEGDEWRRETKVYGKFSMKSFG